MGYAQARALWLRHTRRAGVPAAVLSNASRFFEAAEKRLAEDLLQDTYFSAFRSLAKLTEPIGFRNWLLTIAQNIAIDAARHESRQKRSGPQAHPASLLKVAGTDPGPEENLEQEERRERVLAVLRSLPEEYRLPLTLRYIAGADYETIQTQLGLTNGSLRGLLYRGIKLLRERLPNEL